MLLKAPWPSGNMAEALLAPFLWAHLPWRASLSCCALFSCSGSCRPVLRSSAANAERAVWKPAAALAPWQASRMLQALLAHHHGMVMTQIERKLLQVLQGLPAWPLADLSFLYEWSSTFTVGS